MLVHGVRKSVNARIRWMTRVEFVGRYSSWLLKKWYLMREAVNGNQGHSGRIGYLMREVINGNQRALRGLLVFISS